MKLNKVISPILIAGLLFSAVPAYAAENVAINAEDISSAKLIDLKQQGESSTAEVQGNFREEGNSMIYKINLTESGILSVKADSFDRWLRISLMDKDRNPLSEFENSYHNEFKNDMSIGLPSGEYYIRIKNDNDNVTYKMAVNFKRSSYAETELNNSFETANKIMLNTRYYNFDNNDDLDCYQFDVTESGNIGIKILNPREGGFRYTISDRDGKKIDSFTANDILNTETLNLREGEYYLSISAPYSSYLRGASVPYQLEIIDLKFKDVGADYWASKEISFLSNLKIINGYNTGDFKPNNQVTRGQAASMIARALSLDTSNRPSPSFKDVPKNHWAYGAIAALVADGIYPNGQQFNPNAPLKRDDMARMLVNAYQLKGTSSNEFSDVPNRHWAHNYISALAANKITTGYNDNTFKPNNPVTRAQFASFMARAMDDRYLSVE